MFIVKIIQITNMFYWKLIIKAILYEYHLMCIVIV